MIAKCPFCGGEMFENEIEGGFQCSGCSYSPPSTNVISEPSETGYVSAKILTIKERIAAHNALCARLDSVKELEEQAERSLKRFLEEGKLHGMTRQLLKASEESRDEALKQNAALTADVERLRNSIREYWLWCNDSHGYQLGSTQERDASARQLQKLYNCIAAKEADND